MKYNPAFLKPEELVASFVVRHGELETIIQIIKDNVTKSNQHVLVVGPRGIGKTTLLLRAAEEVRRTKELNDKWYPLVFSEESYSVSTCGEFWLESLLHLAHQTKDEQWQKTYDELLGEKDEKRLGERALAQLMDFADKQGKRILLVVENLNMLLGDQMNDKEAWALRHTLLNEPRVMLLASATSRFEQVKVEGKPMFELFRFLELKPLTGAECRELWASVTGNKEDDARVRPLEILTGGNPRLMAIVSNFAAKMSLKNLMNDLMQLVDEHTEYFKSHLDNLPAVERKVYIALAEIWDPATARQVGESARLNVNKTSSLLARLMERGAVVEANGKGKAKLYQVAERMYNIYYLMRKRGEASQRVRAVVNFMTSFYAAEALVGVVKSIAEEACQLSPSDRTDHYIAYEGVISRIGNKVLMFRIIENTPKDFFEGPTTPQTTKKLLESFEEEELTHKITGLFRKFESIKNNPKQLEKEEKYFRDFVKNHPQKYEGLISLGIFLHRFFVDRYQEAEKAFREATQIAPEEPFAWELLGKLLESQGRYQEAEQAYLNATPFSPVISWKSLGDLYQNRMERFGDAEKAYKKVLEIEPKNRGAWIMLGILFGYRLKRYKDAENVFRKAIELDSNDELAWQGLGLALEENSNYEGAEEAYQKAIDLSKEPASIWNRLGLLLMKQHRLDESEKCFRKAIELDNKQYMASLSLILLMTTNHSRLEEWQKHLKELTRNAEAIKENVNVVSFWFALIAATGYGRELLDILRESAWAEALEPVIVALRLMQGEDVKAAAEVMEVAKDVVKQVEDTKKQFESKKKGEEKK
jgi:Flp pilus assembly protein TadD/DNA polymerase III delta prime subunit